MDITASIVKNSKPMATAVDPPCALPILVVDDDEDILRMTSYVLKQLGYRVVTESDATSALSALKAEKYTPCLIFLDLMMPLMDGATFRKKVLEIPRLSEVPIVILSGDTDLSTKANALQVSGFEQKPISVARLSALAAKYCQATV